MQQTRVTRYAASEAFITKDGSEIRELMHPARHGVRQQSLAEATVPAGASTTLHQHRVSEEIYYVLAGEARMQLGEETMTIGVGDAICIPPGTPHCLHNTGDTPLKVLCCCAPAYSHDDTELLEP
jgi:mannose-6-phosphate isomerase-like protein (cupin superfamily)